MNNWCRENGRIKVLEQEEKRIKRHNQCVKNQLWCSENREIIAPKEKLKKKKKKLKKNWKKKVAFILSDLSNRSFGSWVIAFLSRNCVDVCEIEPGKGEIP